MARSSKLSHAIDVTRACLIVTSLIGAAPASALHCFSCVDCSVGGALSAHKQQCPPEELFCAAVSRPRIGRWGFQSSVVDRGCASSLQVECEQLDPTSTETAAATSATGKHRRHHHDGSRREDDSHRRRGTSGSSAGDFLQKSHCCSTDLCNGSEDARSEGQRRSEEHRRTLMEGNAWKRRSSWGSYFGSGSSDAAGDDGQGMGIAAAVDETIAGGGDDNSAQSTRGGNVGGSRFATVLVIVGTFSQVLWLVSSLVH